MNKLRLLVRCYLAIKLLTGLLLVVVIQIALVLLLSFRYPFVQSDWVFSMVLMAACYIAWAACVVIWYRSQRLSERLND